MRPFQSLVLLSYFQKRIISLFFGGGLEKGYTLSWGRWGGKRIEVYVKIPDSSARAEVQADSASARRGSLSLTTGVFEID